MLSYMGTPGRGRDSVVKNTGMCEIAVKMAYRLVALEAVGCTTSDCRKDDSD